jgi:arsenate reductase-like glutaredoxin family protein
VKNNKTLQIALIIAVRTVLVAGFLGYKYLKKKRDEKKALLKPEEVIKEIIDNSGMEYYKITAPLITDNIFDTADRIHDAIKKIKYLTVGEKVINIYGKKFIITELLAKPEDAERIKKILPIVGNNIQIELTTKEKLVTALPIEKQVEIIKNDVVINNMNDFEEAIKSVENKKPFGYDLTVIKVLPNIEKRVSLDELKKIVEYSKIGIDKLSEVQSKELNALVQKAYTPLVA